MNEKTKGLFLILVLVQGIHSLEEYFGKLWENFPPATLLCSLVSDDLPSGFLIINIGLFVFGILCWIFPLRRAYFVAPIFMWFWILIELINGIAHPIWSLMQKSYTPGVLTAPVLFFISILLIRELYHGKHSS